MTKVSKMVIAALCLLLGLAFYYFQRGKPTRGAVEVRTYSPDSKDETERRMAELAGKLDAMAAEGAAAQSAPPETPADATEPSNIPGAFISRYNCRFPLPDGYEGDSRFHDTQKDIELVMLYPRGTKERAWLSMDKVSPPVIAAEIVPLREHERSDPQYMEKIEAGFKSVAEDNGWKLSVSWIKGNNLSGWLTKVEKPAHYRARLYGKTRLYKFLSRDWEPRLQATVTGFSEKAR